MFKTQIFYNTNGIKSFRKCDPNHVQRKNFWQFHTLLPISQSTSKMQNTKSTTGVICNANDDIFHVIFVLCKNQNSLYVKQNIFSTGKKYVKRI